MEKLLTPICSRLISFIFPAGEAQKNLDTVRRLSSLAACIKADAEKLESALVEVRTHSTAAEQASFCRATVFVAMQELRTVVDEAETLVSAKHWPFPTYGELLYGI